MGLYAISPFSAFKLNVRAAREAIYDTKGNLIQPGRRSLKAVFNQGGGIPDYARGEARERLDFRGVSEDEDPLLRMGWFDLDLAAENEGWDQEEKDAVERRLRERDGADFIIIHQPKLDPPYALYDKHRVITGRRTLEHVVADIRQAYELAGFDIDLAVQYEARNENDERVIAALNSLRAEEQEDEAEPLIAA